MIIACGRFLLCSKVFDFGRPADQLVFAEASTGTREQSGDIPPSCRRSTSSPTGTEKERSALWFHDVQHGRCPKAFAQQYVSVSDNRHAGTRPSMSPSRRTICSTWPFVDGVRHAGSMKETARITDGSAATYRCLISINARTIYVVVWAALIYRSQACVWRRRWNYVFSSKGLDYLSGNDGTGSDGIACGKQKGCIDCDRGAFGWCVGECSLIEGD